MKNRKPRSQSYTSSWHDLEQVPSALSLGRPTCKGVWSSPSIQVGDQAYQGLTAGNSTSIPFVLPLMQVMCACVYFLIEVKLT